MKNLLTVILFLSLSNFLVSQNIYSIEYISELHNTITEEFTLDEVQTVYICGGNYAYAYHSYSDCPGLNNCQAQVYYCSENSAINSYGRTPCCRCWSNVSGRCKEDNPYNTGSAGAGGSTDDGAAEAAAILAGVIVATSVLILSNDVYAYPMVSFTRYENWNGISNDIPQIGYAFGLRKTFENSALEYGATITDPDSYYVVGGHLNFISKIFRNKPIENWDIYTGGTINFIDRNYEWGVGAILGGKAKLTDRLWFDCRYELSTQTNNLRAGLIFTYQKEYFWKK